MRKREYARKGRMAKNDRFKSTIDFVQIKAALFRMPVYCPSSGFDRRH
jgi:hypothetical protein